MTSLLTFVFWIFLATVSILATVLVVLFGLVRPVQALLRHGVVRDWFHEQIIRTGLCRPIGPDRLVLRMVRAIKRSLLVFPSGRTVVPRHFEIALSPADVDELGDLTDLVIDDVQEILLRAALEQGWELLCGPVPQRGHTHSRACMCRITLVADRLLLPGRPVARRDGAHRSSAPTQRMTVPTPGATLETCQDRSALPVLPETMKWNQSRVSAVGTTGTTGVSATGTAFLELRSPDGYTLRPKAAKRALLIGRASTSAFVLAHPSVAPEHARLLPTDDGGWALQRIAEGKVLTVNGTDITKPVRLEDADLVQIGGYRFTARYVDSGDDA